MFGGRDNRCALCRDYSRRTKKAARAAPCGSAVLTQRWKWKGATSTPRRALSIAERKAFQGPPARTHVRPGEPRRLPVSHKLRTQVRLADGHQLARFLATVLRNRDAFCTPLV